MDLDLYSEQWCWWCSFSCMFPPTEYAHKHETEPSLRRKYVHFELFLMKLRRCSFWFFFNWLFAYKGLDFVPILRVFFIRDSKKSDLYSRLPVSVSIRFEIGVTILFFLSFFFFMYVYVWWEFIDSLFCLAIRLGHDLRVCIW